VKIYKDTDMLLLLRHLTGEEWAVVYSGGAPDYGYFVQDPSPTPFEEGDTGYITAGQREYVDENGVIYTRTGGVS
jgi:hypothetical protein